MPETGPSRQYTKHDVLTEEEMARVALHPLVRGAIDDFRKQSGLEPAGRRYRGNPWRLWVNGFPSGDVVVRPTSSEA